MLEPRARLRFAQEALAEGGGERLGENLDRRGAAEGGVVREEDLPHSAGAQAALDPVVRERLADHGWAWREILSRRGLPHPNLSPPGRAARLGGPPRLRTPRIGYSVLSPTSNKHEEGTVKGKILAVAVCALSSRRRA